MKETLDKKTVDDFSASDLKNLASHAKKMSDLFSKMREQSGIYETDGNKTDTEPSVKAGTYLEGEVLEDGTIDYTAVKMVEFDISASAQNGPYKRLTILKI